MKVGPRPPVARIETREAPPPVAPEITPEMPLPPTQRVAPSPLAETAAPTRGAPPDDLIEKALAELERAVAAYVKDGAAKPELDRATGAVQTLIDAHAAAAAALPDGEREPELQRLKHFAARFEHRLAPARAAEVARLHDPGADPADHHRYAVQPLPVILRGLRAGMSGADTSKLDPIEKRYAQWGVAIARCKISEDDLQALLASGDPNDTIARVIAKAEATGEWTSLNAARGLLHLGIAAARARAELLEKDPATRDEAARLREQVKTDTAFSRELDAGSSSCRIAVSAGDQQRAAKLRERGKLAEADRLDGAAAKSLEAEGTHLTKLARGRKDERAAQVYVMAAASHVACGRTDPAPLADAFRLLDTAEKVAPKGKDDEAILDGRAEAHRVRRGHSTHDRRRYWTETDALQAVIDRHADVLTQKPSRTVDEAQRLVALNVESRDLHMERAETYAAADHARKTMQAHKAGLDQIDTQLDESGKAITQLQESAHNEREQAADDSDREAAHTSRAQIYDHQATVVITQRQSLDEKRTEINGVIDADIVRVRTLEAEVAFMPKQSASDAVLEAEKRDAAAARAALELVRVAKPGRERTRARQQEAALAYDSVVFLSRASQLYVAPSHSANDRIRITINDAPPAPLPLDPQDFVRRANDKLIYADGLATDFPVELANDAITARTALSRAAPQTAVEHLRRAAEIVETLPPDERDLAAMQLADAVYETRETLRTTVNADAAAVQRAYDLERTLVASLPDELRAPLQTRIDTLERSLSEMPRVFAAARADVLASLQTALVDLQLLGFQFRDANDVAISDLGNALGWLATFGQWTPERHLDGKTDAALATTLLPRIRDELTYANLSVDVIEGLWTNASGEPDRRLELLTALTLTASDTTQRAGHEALKRFESPAVRLPDGMKEAGIVPNDLVVFGIADTAVNPSDKTPNSFSSRALRDVPSLAAAFMSPGRLPDDAISAKRQALGFPLPASAYFLARGQGAFTEYLDWAKKMAIVGIIAEAPLYLVPGFGQAKAAQGAASAARLVWRLRSFAMAAGRLAAINLGTYGAVELSAEILGRRHWLTKAVGIAGNFLTFGESARISGLRQVFAQIVLCEAQVIGTQVVVPALIKDEDAALWIGMALNVLVPAALGGRTPEPATHAKELALRIAPDHAAALERDLQAPLAQMARAQSAKDYDAARTAVAAALDRHGVASGRRDAVLQVHDASFALAAAVRTHGFNAEDPAPVVDAVAQALVARGMSRGDAFDLAVLQVGMAAPPATKRAHAHAIVEQWAETVRPTDVAADSPAWRELKTLLEAQALEPKAMQAFEAALDPILAKLPKSDELRTVLIAGEHERTVQGGTEKRIRELEQADVVITDSIRRICRDAAETEVFGAPREQTEKPGPQATVAEIVRKLPPGAERTLALAEHAQQRNTNDVDLSDIIRSPEVRALPPETQLVIFEQVLREPGRRNALVTLASSRELAALDVSTQRSLLLLGFGPENPLSRPGRVALDALLASDDFVNAPPQDRANLLENFLHDGAWLPELVTVPEGAFDDRRASFEVRSVAQKTTHTFDGGDEMATRHDVVIDGQTIPVWIADALPGSTLHRPSVETIAKMLAALPVANRKSVVEVRINCDESVYDAVTRVRLGDPDFVSFMRAGAAGIINVYPLAQLPTQSAFDGAGIHETGHIASRQRWGLPKNGGWAEWQRVIERDGIAASQYGRSNAEEDFSESVSLYMLVRGTAEEASTRALMPEHFATLDRFFADGALDTNAGVPDLSGGNWSHATVDPRTGETRLLVDGVLAVAKLEQIVRKNPSLALDLDFTHSGKNCFVDAFDPVTGLFHVRTADGERVPMSPALLATIGRRKLELRLQAQDLPPSGAEARTTRSPSLDGVLAPDAIDTLARLDLFELKTRVDGGSGHEFKKMETLLAGKSATEMRRILEGAGFKSKSSGKLEVWKKGNTTVSLRIGPEAYGAAVRALPSFAGRALTEIRDTLGLSGFVRDQKASVNGEEVWTHPDGSLVRIKLEPPALTSVRPLPNVVKEISMRSETWDQKNGWQTTPSQIFVKVTDVGDVFTPVRTDQAEAGLRAWFYARASEHLAHLDPAARLTKIKEAWEQSKDALLKQWGDLTHTTIDASK